MTRYCRPASESLICGIRDPPLDRATAKPRQRQKSLLKMSAEIALLTVKVEVPGFVPGVIEDGEN